VDTVLPTRYVDSAQRILGEIEDNGPMQYNGPSGSLPLEEL